MLAASTPDFSFHVWEVLWDSCQLRVASQPQIPSNTYLRETFRERLELIVIQVQIPTADQRPERWRQLADVAPCQAPVLQFVTFKVAVLEHLLPICTRADEHDMIHQDLGRLAVLASAEQLPYPLLHQPLLIHGHLQRLDNTPVACKPTAHLFSAAQSRRLSCCTPPS